MFKNYRRKGITQMRPFEAGEQLPANVSILEADKQKGSPKVGDWIARASDNHDDQWLVEESHFNKQGYVEVPEEPVLEQEPAE